MNYSNPNKWSLGPRLYPKSFGPISPFINDLDFFDSDTEFLSSFIGWLNK